MTKLYKTHPLQERGFGWDSIQGALEYIDQTSERGGYPDAWVYTPEPKSSYSSRLYQRFKALQDEQYAVIDWEETLVGSQKGVRISNASLTVKGLLLLDELRQKGGFARFKNRLADIAWAVIASIITTLLTLSASG